MCWARTYVELDTVQTTEGRRDRAPIGRSRRTPWNVGGQPDRPLVVNQEGPTIEGPQRRGNLGQVKCKKMQQLMLPRQALQIERRMLDMKHHRPFTLQEEDLVGVAAGEPPG